MRIPDLADDSFWRNIWNSWVYNFNVFTKTSGQWRRKNKLHGYRYLLRHDDSCTLPRWERWRDSSFTRSNNPLATMLKRTGPPSWSLASRPVEGDAIGAGDDHGAADFSRRVRSHASGAEAPRLAVSRRRRFLRRLDLCQALEPGWWQFPRSARDRCWGRRARSP